MNRKNLFLGKLKQDYKNNNKLIEEEFGFYENHIKKKKIEDDFLEDYKKKNNFVYSFEKNIILEKNKLEIEKKNKNSFFLKAEGRKSKNNSKTKEFKENDLKKINFSVEIIFFESEKELKDFHEKKKEFVSKYQNLESHLTLYSNLLKNEKKELENNILFKNAFLNKKKNYQKKLKIIFSENKKIEKIEKSKIIPKSKFFMKINLKKQFEEIKFENRQKKSINLQEENQIFQNRKDSEFLNLQKNEKLKEEKFLKEINNGVNPLSRFLKENAEEKKNAAYLRKLEKQLFSKYLKNQYSFSNLETNKTLKIDLKNNLGKKQLENDDFLGKKKNKFSIIPIIGNFDYLPEEEKNWYIEDLTKQSIYKECKKLSSYWRGKSHNYPFIFKKMKIISNNFAGYDIYDLFDFNKKKVLGKEDYKY